MAGQAGAEPLPAMRGIAQTLGTLEITKDNAEDVHATYDMSGKVG